MVKKTVIKVARLAMMPPGFNLYRISKGIKPPMLFFMSCSQADTMLHNWKQTYQVAYRLTDESRDFNSIVSTSYYNRLLGLAEKKLLEQAQREQQVSDTKIGGSTNG